MQLTASTLLLTLYINLGKSGVSTALQIPDHNWLGYGQIKNWAFAKVDIEKREHNDGVMGPCHTDTLC